MERGLVISWGHVHSQKITGLGDRLLLASGCPMHAKRGTVWVLHVENKRRACSVAAPHGEAPMVAGPPSAAGPPVFSSGRRMADRTKSPHPGAHEK